MDHDDIGPLQEAEEENMSTPIPVDYERPRDMTPPTKLEQIICDVAPQQYEQLPLSMRRCQHCGGALEDDPDDVTAYRCLACGRWCWKNEAKMTRTRDHILRKGRERDNDQ